MAHGQWGKGTGFGREIWECRIRDEAVRSRIDGVVLGPGVMVSGILAGDYCPDRQRAHEGDREMAVANATVSSLAGGTTGPVKRLAQGWSRNQRD